MRVVTIFGGLLLFIMLAAPGFAVAETQGAYSMPDRLVEFYNHHIDMKIASAERHASMADSGNREARCLARRGKEEAEFYKLHREELMNGMFGEGIGMKSYKVHLFLTNAFIQAHPEVKSIC